MLGSKLDRKISRLWTGMETYPANKRNHSQGVHCHNYVPSLIQATIKSADNPKNVMNQKTCSHQYGILKHATYHTVPEMIQASFEVPIPMSKI